MRNERTSPFGGADTQTVAVRVLEAVTTDDGRTGAMAVFKSVEFDTNASRLSASEVQFVSIWTELERETTRQLESDTMSGPTPDGPGLLASISRLGRSIIARRSTAEDPKKKGIGVRLP